MFKPKLYPSFSEVAKYRATGNVRGGFQGGRGGGGDGGGGAGGGGAGGGEEILEVLENSRDRAVNQMEREAMDMARTAKEVKKSKAFKQKADLERRRQQFGEGNVITFILDVPKGSKPRDIYAHEIGKLLTHAGFKEDDISGIKKNEWRNYQIEVELNEGVVFNCEEIEKKIRDQAKLGYSVSKFAYSEDTFKISGIPFHKNKDLVRGLIKEAISPFVQEVLMVEPGKYYDNKLGFFHGKENGEWKVKVVARVGVLVPTFIIVGKKSKVVTQVNYIKISSDMSQEEICYDCYKVGHKKFSEVCEGSIQVNDFANEFEEIWKKNMDEKGLGNGGDLEEEMQRREGSDREKVSRLEQDLQVQAQELQAKVQDLNEKEQFVEQNRLEMEGLRKEMENLRRSNSESGVVEGARLDEMQEAMGELKSQIEGTQKEKVRREKENEYIIENLRIMQREAVKENKELVDRSKVVDEKCLVLVEEVSAMSVEKADLLGKIDKLSSELVAVDVVKDLLNEVEIMARTVESVSKVSNVDDGVVNRIPINPSLNNGDLSFQDSGEEEDVFVQSSSEQVQVEESEKESDGVIMEEGLEGNGLRDVADFGPGGSEIGFVSVEQVPVIVQKESENESEDVNVEKREEEKAEEDNGFRDGEDPDPGGSGIGTLVGETGIKVKKGKLGKKKKRRLSPDAEVMMAGKRVKAKDYPKENACIQFLKEGIWITARVKQRVYKSKQKFWYNVEHMNEDTPDACVDLEDPELWRYPGEDLEVNKFVKRVLLSTSWEEVECSPSIVVTMFDEENLEEESELEFKDVPDPHGAGEGSSGIREFGNEDNLQVAVDYGSPLLRIGRGVIASSPDLGLGDCEKLMERNIEQFGSVSSIGNEDQLSNSRMVSPVGASSQLLSVSQAVLTPYRLPSGPLSVSEGSETDL